MFMTHTLDGPPSGHYWNPCRNHCKALATWDRRRTMMDEVATIVNRKTV